ncbi:MAG: hypothetical protein PUP90_06970 [Nostoc sp. S4]|nr:hypothetical protein [Nostoc sp. S4]
MVGIPKPKPINERQVRIQAIKVRSAAARLRYLASSVRAAAKSLPKGCLGVSGLRDG